MIKTLFKYSLGILPIVLLPFMLLVTFAFFKQDHKDRDFSKKFREPKQYVRSFLAQHHRLPTPDEFQSSVHEWMCYLLTKEQNPEQFRGAKSDNDYVISIWRGEWYEYYYSWTNKDTSIQVNYFLLRLAFLALWSGYVYASYRLFKWRPHKMANQAL